MNCIVCNRINNIINKNCSNCRNEMIEQWEPIYELCVNCNSIESVIICRNKSEFHCVVCETYSQNGISMWVKKSQLHYHPPHKNKIRSKM
jgi:hypothetical protein